MDANTPNTVIHKIAQVVKYHRKSSGLTQIELAHLAGVGKTSIFDIEHEKKTIQLETLIKILNALNITFELNGPLMKNFKEEMNEAG